MYETDGHSNGCDSGLDGEKWTRRLASMIGSEDCPLMTVGELARALGVPREFVYTYADELGAIRRRLRSPSVCITPWGAGGRV